MRYVVGFMMVTFFLGGVGLFGAGVRDSSAVSRPAPPAAGRGRDRPDRETPGMHGHGKREDGRVSLPGDQVPSPTRGDQTFTSEIGAGARAARYAVGQKIAVLYDPDGEIRP